MTPPVTNDNPPRQVPSDDRSTAELVDVQCPRCGYDLRTQFAQRDPEDRSAAGLCPECGLGIEWERLLRDAAHPWLFEYHWRQRPFSSLCLTVRSAAMPWRFWKATDLYDRIRVVPLIVLILIPLVVVSVTRLGEMVFFAYEEWSAPGSWANFILGGSPITTPAAAPWDEILRAAAWAFMPNVFWRFLVVLPVIGAFVYWPVAFGLVPLTLSRARVRFMHLFRIFAYSVVAPLYGLACWSLVSVALNRMDWYAWSIHSPPDWWWYYGYRPGLHAMYAASGWFVVAAGATFLWAAFWWLAACRWYLLLKAWRRVMLGLGVIVALLLMLQYYIPMAWIFT